MLILEYISKTSQEAKATLLPKVHSCCRAAGSVQVMQEDQMSVLHHSLRLPTCLFGCTELTTVIPEAVTTLALELICEM